MAQPNNRDQLLDAWRAMDGRSDQGGWRTITIHRDARYYIRAGRRSPSNEECLLVGIREVGMPSNGKLPQGQGFSVLPAELDDDGKDHRWMALSRLPGGKPDLFTIMCLDIIDALEKASDASGARLLAILLGRIRAWQDFMKRSPLGILSTEEEIGLMGELAVLLDLFESGLGADALDGWKGPLDGLHDFLLGPGAIEVKATTAPVGFLAEIASLEQLDDGAIRPIFLAAVRLPLSTSGQTLPEYVGHVVRMIESVSGGPLLFEQRLLAAGYVDLYREHYTRRFSQADIRYLPVDDRTPRLTVANVPQAIRRVRYTMDLEGLPVMTGGVIDVLKMLGLEGSWT